MHEVVTEFRTVEGIGEAIERRLHAAGVESWLQLADVASAFAAIRDLSGQRLREIAKEATRHARAAGEEPPRLQEHTESFVVRVYLGDENTALRTQATDTRTNEERRWTGWAPDELSSFIATHAGIGGASISPRHKIVPIGRVVGGTARTVETALELEPASGGRVFRAELIGRRLGVDEPLLGPLAVRQGEVPEGTALELSFDDVELPEGVVDLIVALELGTALVGA